MGLLWEYWNKTKKEEEYTNIYYTFSCLLFIFDVAFFLNRSVD